MMILRLRGTLIDKSVQTKYWLCKGQLKPHDNFSTKAKNIYTFTLDLTHGYCSQLLLVGHDSIPSASQPCLVFFVELYTNHCIILRINISY